MTYRQVFDRLGNQVTQPTAKWHHRAIQTVCWAIVVVCIALLATGPGDRI